MTSGALLVATVSMEAAGMNLKPASPAPSDVDDSAAVVQPKQMRVLVIDDESLIRWSVAETLRDRGITVITAADGQSAIEACKTSPTFDVVLMDLQLPDVLKWSLLTHLKQITPASAIVLMTAFYTPDLAADALERGACLVLRKPFELSDLAELVVALGDSSRD